MIETYFNMILYPVKEFLKLFIDDKLTSYLGVNLMGAIVTGIIMMIVFKTLVNPVAIGSMAVERENINTRKENKAAAEAARSRSQKNG